MESGKVRKALYDEVIIASDAGVQCEVCLTRGQVRWILSQTDYAGWQTRWYTMSNSAIESDKIQAMRDDLIERLFMSCCDDNLPILRRVDPDTGQVEVSTDGGFTYHPDPDDPRNSGIALPPPVVEGGSVSKCNAANSVTWQLQIYTNDVIQSKVNELTLIEIALAIAAICLAIWVAPAWALLPGLIIPLIQPLFQASVAELSAAMSITTYELFTCAIFCNMHDDGTLSEAGFLEALVTMKNTIPDALAYNTCRAFMLIYGRLGVNNSAAQGNDYGFNCDGCTCDCVVKFDVKTGSILETPYYEGYTSYLSAEGIPGTAYAINIRTPDDDACCQILDVKFDLVGETGGGFTPFSILKWDCGTDRDGVESGGALVGSCVNRIRPAGHPTGQSGQQFVMSILFGDCP